MQHDVDGAWHCVGCGARINGMSTDDADHLSVTVHGSGGALNERVLSVRGVEVHRCTPLGQPLDPAK